MSVEWPTRPVKARRDGWTRNLTTGNLRLLSAVMKLSGSGALPPWAEPLVARIRAETADAPEPPRDAPRPTPPDPDAMLRHSADFAAAIAAAWPTAAPATRAALRVVAAALGVEVPPEPESARVAPADDPPKGIPPADPMPPAGAPLAPGPNPTGDEPTPDPEPASTRADASAAEPPAPDPKPARRRPRTCWEAYWDLGDEDPFEGRTPLGWANGV